MKGEYLDYQPIILCILSKYRNFQIEKHSKHIAPGSIGFFLKCLIFKMSQFRRKRSISSISNVAFHFATIMLLPVSPLAAVLPTSYQQNAISIYFIMFRGTRADSSGSHFDSYGLAPSKESRCGWCLKYSKFIGYSALLMFF